MIFFTSDLHIGHDKPFLYEPRGFSSIIDHDTAVLNNWNSIVTDEDTVYILGDLCLGQDILEQSRIFYNLKGIKKFIYGNHDTSARIERYKNDYNMEDLGYANVLKYSKKYSLYLSHYPTFCSNMDDEIRHHYVINLCGHTHFKDKFFNNNKYIYNVSLDAHNCYPVSVDDIMKDIREFKS